MFIFAPSSINRRLRCASHQYAFGPTGIRLWSNLTEPNGSKGGAGIALKIYAQGKAKADKSTTARIFRSALLQFLPTSCNCRSRGVEFLHVVIQKEFVGMRAQAQSIVL